MNARWRGIPMALKALALCVLALVVLLILLPAPPERDLGGATVVAKYVPKLRDTVDPLAKAVRPIMRNFRRNPPASVSPVQPPSAQIPAPSPIPPPAPKPAQNVAVAPPPELPSPARKPAETPPPDQSKPKRTLPWQIPGETARLPAEPPPAPNASSGADLPSRSDIDGWVKSQAWEFLGGVDAQGNILYRFEVWLEAPQNTLKGIKSVSYDYDAPSATPKSRETSRADGGFRVRFGSLACSKEITITLKMTDGRSQRTKVDGCRVLN